MLRFLKGKIHVIVQLAVSGIVIYLLLTQIPYDQIQDTIKESQVYYLALSFSCLLAIVVVSTIRWRILLRCIQMSRSFALIFRITFVTFFFNIYLPGGVAGEVARVFMLKRTSGPGEGEVDLSRVTASVLTDRIIGMLGLVLLSMIGFIVNMEALIDAELQGVFITTTVIIVGASVFLFSAGLQRFLLQLVPSSLHSRIPFREAGAKFLGSFSEFGKYPADLVQVVALTLSSHILMILSFYFLAQSINLDISFVALFTFMPLIDIISAIPISFGGIGIRELIIVLLFSTIGIAASMAMSISILYFVLLLLIGAIGGLMYLYGSLKSTN